MRIKQKRYKAHKAAIRFFMQAHYTDARLAELLAHAKDGKLSFHSCCCFIGVVTANHALRTAALIGIGPDDFHYKRAKTLEGAVEAEMGFRQLSFNPDLTIQQDDEIRRRILIPMIRAEMKRREQLRAKENADADVVPQTQRRLSEEVIGA